jgi:outer membrane protein assembly factor BamB
MGCEKMRSITLLMLCIGLASTMAASDWECFKGSPERTGSSDQASPDTPYLLWQVDLGSELYSSPVVKGDKVFQVACEELFCINLNSGEIIWSSSVPAYYSTPVISEDKVIVATNRGIAAYSIDRGDLLWEYQMSVLLSRFPIENHIVSSPVISEGRVVAGAMPLSYAIIDGFLIGRRNELFVFCVDETGKKKWYVETTLGVSTSPCVSHGRVFVASRELLCIDLKRGHVIWNSEDKIPFDYEHPRKELYSFNDSTPIIYHGILIGGSCITEYEKSSFTGWQKIVFIDQYTGDFLWEWVKKGILASSPAIYKGKIYFYSHDGMVWCISFLDGKDLWNTPISEPEEYEPHGKPWPSPTVADNKVYIGSIEGVFYCLDAETGKILWKYETEGEIRSAPAVVPGKVLVSSTDGKLYCFGIDPTTYKMKAQQYIEEKMYDKAKEFLLEAKEYAKTNEDTEEINHLLDSVEKEMPEYIKRQEKLDKAESFMDEADKIMWNKKFRKAKTLYTKAYEIYTELDDEFKIKFCEKRIEYIEKRISEENWLKTNWWLLVILTGIGVISVFLVRKYR